MDKRTRDGRVNRHPGITERNGRCLISYIDASGNRRQSLTRHPFPSGIDNATRERNRLEREGPTSESARVPLFGELAQIWLDSSDMTPSSRRTAKGILNNHWLPVIGSDPLDRITYARLRAIMATLSNKAPKTRANILSPVRSICDLGIQSEFINKNPCAPFGKTKHQRPAIDPFERAERDKILRSLKGNSLLFYTIRFFDGLRPGEVIALTWRDIDLKAETANVDKQIVEGVHRSSTKTHERRTVRLHPNTVLLLKSLPRRLDSGHIFVNQYGQTYQRGESFAEVFNKTRLKLKIRHRSPYNVRHTCACMMLEAGLKPGYCAKQLGHSLDMFFRTYAEWIDKDEGEAQHNIWKVYA